MSEHPLCPMCGASGPDRCELEGECGGICPWVESGQHKRDCKTVEDEFEVRHG